MRISIAFAVCLFLAASLATGGALLGVTKGDLEEGRKLYLAFCSSCHGSRGKGDGWAAKFLSTPPRDHTDQSYMGHKTDQDLYEFISAGERAFHGSKYMPRWSMKLEPKQIWDLIAYMRTLYRAPQGDPIEGRKLYLTFCTSCHGRNGRGDGPMTKYLDAKPMDHTDDGVMSTKTDRDLYSALSGSEGPFHGSKYMRQWRLKFQPDQIWDLIAYIRYLHRKPTGGGSPPRGKEVYDKYCWACHGQKGRGDGPISEAFGSRMQDLGHAKYMATRTDLDIYFAIRGGGKAVGESELMPAWGGVLSESQIWDLVGYIRSLRH